jgi:glutamate-1-semialdehyde 2,1-aminomutase
MIAGYTLLQHLKNNPAIYTELETKTGYLKNGLLKVFSDAGIPATINQLGSMMSVFFSASPVNNFADASASDISRFNTYFHAMLEAGIYLPPSGYESWFLSNALSYDDLNATIEAAKKAVEK